MQIIFHPTRSDTPMTVARAGDVLTIDGTAFDFGLVPEGATLPRAAIDCPMIAGDVTREHGVLRVPLLLPHAADAPDTTRFPDPLVLDQDGPIVLPAFTQSPEEL